MINLQRRKRTQSQDLRRRLLKNRSPSVQKGSVKHLLTLIQKGKKNPDYPFQHKAIPDYFRIHFRPLSRPRKKKLSVDSEILGATPYPHPIRAIGKDLDPVVEGEDRANESRKYADLQNSQVDPTYKSVQRYFNDWRAISAKARNKGLPKDSANHFLKPIPYSVLGKLMEKLDVKDINDLYRPGELTNIMDCLQNLYNRAVIRYEKTGKADNAYLIKPRTSEKERIRHAGTLPENYNRHFISQRKNKQSTSSGSKSKEKTKSTHSSSTHTGSEDKSLNAAMEKLGIHDIKDLTKYVEEQVRQAISRHFTNSGKNLPLKDKTSRKTRESHKIQANAYAVTDNLKENQDSSDSPYSSSSSLSANSLDVEVRILTTGDIPTKMAPPKGKRCKYCFKVGHRMDFCKTIVSDAANKICQKVGTSYNSWEAGTKGNTHTPESLNTAGFRIFINRHWITGTYKRIGVRAAIFMWLYEAGQIYGWTFPGAKYVKKLKKSPAGENIPWGFAKNLDWALHIKPNYPLSVLRAREISFTTAFQKLKKKYPKYSKLIAEDIALIEVHISNPDITKEDIARQKGYRTFKKLKNHHEGQDSDLEIFKAPKQNRPSSAPQENTQRKMAMAYSQYRRQSNPKRPFPSPKQQDRIMVVDEKEAKDNRKRMAFDIREDPKGKKAATENLYRPIIRLSVLQYARKNPTWAKESANRLLRAAGLHAMQVVRTKEVDAQGNSIIMETDFEDGIGGLEVGSVFDNDEEQNENVFSEMEGFHELTGININNIEQILHLENGQEELLYKSH
ncbi:hypothetical protein MKZ38_007066 [Zalerion maritima]|uniref:Uncharacterized protein n=1 Tax=Zalerion maritima TaxID=339359 RepID=A0AAD5RIX3_9PEZI|nr:hypothetical protein MKZ38_007066 [Zalerion maritima]